MTRRRIARIALVLIALGAGLLASPTTTGAATVSKSSWWHRTSEPSTFIPPAARPPVPLPDTPTDPVAPPNVPEGSVLVEGTPEGATAVAAITYLLVEGESSPVLTITPAQPVPPTSVILACRAATDWTMPETQPGRWQDKPLVDCGRSVNGIPNDDGSVWTFPVAPLVSGSDLDVVLVPGTTGDSTPAGNVGSAFSMTFDTAEGAVLATNAAPSTSAGSGSSSSGPVVTFAPATQSFGGDTGFTAPETAVVAPSLEPQDQAPSIPQQPMLQTPAAAEDDTTSEGVAFLILLAGLAAAGWAYVTPDRNESGVVGLGRFRRPVPAEALATAEPVPGGLGRFARPRTGAPPSLS